ncbi:MAG TPA: LytTR family DNA-binding domain-containing protein [Candidatus Mediterraneibacter intestinavium]|nr:LytTR family DNA-binding domain-containing protein [Candidatus Mediterraneibacter intestinavium]
MIRIAVCEDSIPVQAQIEDHISEMLTDCPVEVFSSGEELLSFLSREKRRFSLYLMDISLPGISGIETAAAIRERDPYALIIFITDYKEYVYEVFETLPYRFITKPIDKDIFHKAISDAVNYITDRGELFHFHVDRVQYQIPFQEIIYFESNLRRVTLHTGKEAFSFYGRLRDLSEHLNPILFVRTHASYLVNMEYIRSIRDAEVLLSTGEHIPVSRKYRPSVRDKHLEYMKWRAAQ